MFMDALHWLRLKAPIQHVQATRSREDLIQHLEHVAAANAWRRLAVIALSAEESRVQLDEVDICLYLRSPRVIVSLHAFCVCVSAHACTNIRAYPS